MSNNSWEALVVDTLRDADSFETEEGTEVRVAGLNAHERNNPGGMAATDWAQSIVDKADLEIKPTGETDVYGRQVADVRFKDTGASYSEAAIRQGHAAPYGSSATDGDHLAEQQSVAAKVLGVMPRTVDGSFDLDLNSRSGINTTPGGGSFTRAMGRGKDQLDATVYAAGNASAKLVGDIIGTETLDDWGMEGLRKNLIEAAMNPADISSWDDVKDMDSFLTYVVEALGEQVPNMAAMLGTGGLGSIAIRAAVGKKLLQTALKKETSKLGKDAGSDALGKAALTAKKEAFDKSRNSTLYKNSSIPGVTAASYTMGVGEIHQELMEGGIDSPGTAFLGAIPFAALDTLGFQATIGRLFKGVDKDIATQSIKDIAKSMVGAGLLGAGAESSTEMLQEIITLSSRAYHDPTFEIFSEENIHRIREAGIKAGIVGGVSAGSATGANKAYGKLVTPKRDTNYDYLPDEAKIPTKELLGDEAPEGEEMSVRDALEKVVDPKLDEAEKSITAYEALMRCVRG